MQGVKLLLSLSGEKLRGLRKSVLWSLSEMIFVIVPYLLAVRTLNTIHAGASNIFFKVVAVFLLLLLCIGLRLFFRWKGYYTTQVCGVDFSTDLRRVVGDHYRKLSLGYFSGKDLGELSGDMLKSVTDVENLVTEVFSNMIVLSSGLLLFLAGIFVMDFRLGLAIIGVIALAIPFLLLSNRSARKYGKENQKATFSTSDRVMEYVYGIKTIKSYNLGLDQLKQTKQVLYQQYKMSLKTEFKVAPLVQAFGMLVDIALPVGIVVALLLVAAGNIESMRILSFLLSAPRIFTMVFLLSVMFTEQRLCLNSVDSLTAVLQVPEQQGNGAAPGSTCDITFENVQFSYQQTQVLTDISFAIPQGSFTAIVGPSGSGKTTIANLMARFWDVNSGRILLGGVNIQDLPPEQLLSKISMVFQNVFLFNDTIYNNVTLGDNETYSREQVYAAMNQAQMDNILARLPDGADTMVGEGGSTLSGGERQRLSIARALLKNAPILILDEATASLDAENEHSIQKAFDAAAKERTLIVIAHRLATVEAADQILVLSEQGHLVQQGTHAQLVGVEGQYKQLWDAQQESAGWSV